MDKIYTINSVRIDNENSLDASKSFRELINKNSEAKDLMLEIKSLAAELSYLGEKLLISKSSSEIKNKDFNSY